MASLTGATKRMIEPIAPRPLPFRRLLLDVGTLFFLGKSLFSRPEEDEPQVQKPAAQPKEAAPPAPSNYDLDGPPTNSSTAMPAPDPQELTPVDEASETAAAAKEAGHIGGDAPQYDETDPSTRPLAEGGSGVSEGSEIADADLIDNAGPPTRSPLAPDPRIEE